MEYHAWDSVFNEYVNSTATSGAERLNLLNDYLTGKPKQAIKGYIPFQSQEAYLLAKEKVKAKYGNASVVSAAFTNHLKS